MLLRQYTILIVLLQESEHDHVVDPARDVVRAARGPHLRVPQHPQVHGDGGRQQLRLGELKLDADPGLGDAAEPDVHALLHHQPDLPPHADHRDPAHGGAHLHEHTHILG